MIHSVILFLGISIISSILFVFNFDTYALLVCFGIGSVIFFKIVFHIRYKLVFIIVCVFMHTCSFLYIQQKINTIQKQYNAGFILEPNTIQTIEGAVVEFPRYSFANNQYIIQINGTHTQLQIFTQLHQKFEYLDTLKITTRIQDVREQDSAWQSYYQRLNVQYTMLYPSHILQTKSSPQTFNQNIKYKLFHFKKYIRAESTKRFSSHTNALVLGMLFGEKNELSKDEKDIFNTAQLSHILVVSGYNVSLVITLLFWLLSSFHRYIRVIGTLSAIVLFVVLIGYDASVVRAGLMGCILVLAKMIHRPGSAINTLCVAAILMMIHNPLVLFDAGFHLSFIATYGLLIMPRIKIIPEYILSTIWIFLFVAPYILYMTKSISFLGIFTNIAVLFVVPFFMLLSLVSIILAISSIYIGVDILILDVLSRYIFFVAYSVQNIPRIFITIPAQSIVVWYVVLFGLLIFFQNKYTTKEFIEKHYQKFVPQRPN